MAAQTTEISPAELGIDPEKLEAVFARAKRDIDDGTLPNAQLAVARNNRIAGFRTYGTASLGGVERPATNETLFTIFSATKAIVASAIWLLLERGELRLEQKVVELIPEFGSNGKDVVTVEQVLLHTGGFPQAPFDPAHWDDREKRLAAFARWWLTFEPGSRFEYHAVSAHWVLAEIIERLTGRDFRQFIREEITGPAGLDEIYLGLPEDKMDRVAKVHYVGEPVEPPWGWNGVNPNFLLALNDPIAQRVGVPGGGAVTTAAQVALFYQVLLNGGVAANGRQILKPETIAMATANRAPDHFVDPNQAYPVLRGLSVVIAGDDGYSHFRGMGKTLSPRSFGHNGAGGQIVWGDPETGISLCYLTSGFVDYLSEGRRTTAIASLAASKAGLLASEPRQTRP
ncbi:MAG: serine hydrolase domain-containing protein [Dehalococcoidia bacterium]